MPEGWQPAALELASAHDDLAGLGAVAAEFRRRFEQVPVLGIGGSSLGGQTLARPGGWRLRPAPRRAAALLYGEHRPASFAALFAAIDPGKTGIIAISKSGGTAEPQTQLMIAID